MAAPAPALIAANEPQPPRPCGGAGPYKILIGEGFAIAARLAPAMEEPLSLLVRSPAQRHRDLRLSAEPAWTVRRLKTELRRLLPDAPVSARSPLPAAPPGGSLRAAWPGGWLDAWLGGRWGLAPRDGCPGAVAGLWDRYLPPQGVLVPVASAALGARLGRARAILGLVCGPAAVNH